MTFSNHDKKESEVTTRIPKIQPNSLQEVLCVLSNGWLVYSERRYPPVDLCVYDDKNNKLIAKLDETGSNRLMCLPLEDGQFVYTSWYSNQNRSLKLFDPSLKNPVEIVNDLTAERIALAPGGRQVIAYESSKSLKRFRLIDLESKQTTFLNTDKEVTTADPYPLAETFIRHITFFQNDIVTVNQVGEKQSAQTLIKRWGQDGTLKTCYKLPFHDYGMDINLNRLVLSNFSNLDSICVFDLLTEKSDSFVCALSYGFIRLLFPNIIIYSARNDLIFFHLDTREKITSIPIKGGADSFVVSATGDVYCTTDVGIIRIQNPLKELFLKESQAISEGSGLSTNLSNLVTEYLLDIRTKIFRTKQYPKDSDNQQTSDASDQPKPPIK